MNTNLAVLAVAYDNITGGATGGTGTPSNPSPGAGNSFPSQTITFDGTNFTSGWTVGDEIVGDSSGAIGIITAISGAGDTQAVTSNITNNIAFAQSENTSNNDANGIGWINII